MVTKPGIQNSGNDGVQLVYAVAELSNNMLATFSQGGFICAGIT